MPLSRRAFLTAGGAAAAAWITSDIARLREAAAYAANAALQDPPPKFKVLDAAGAADIEAATSRIIPSDDGPGAREARVVYFIDEGLAGWQSAQRDAWTKGVAELRRRARRRHGAGSFAALTPSQQDAVIAALEKEKHDFFFTLRGATVMGFLSHPSHGGNAGKAGWQAIGFDDRFSWAAPFGWYDANAR